MSIIDKRVLSTALSVLWLRRVLPHSGVVTWLTSSVTSQPRPWTSPSRARSSNFSMSPRRLHTPPRWPPTLPPVVSLVPSHWPLSTHLISLVLVLPTTPRVSISVFNCSGRSGPQLEIFLRNKELTLIFITRQGRQASVQRFDRCLQEDLGLWRYWWSLPWFRHLLCRYLHLPWSLLRYLRYCQANHDRWWWFLLGLIRFGLGCYCCLWFGLIPNWYHPSSYDDDFWYW